MARLSIWRHVDKHHSAFQRTVVAMDCCKYRPKFRSLADALEGIRPTPGTPGPRHILGLYLFRDHMNHNRGKSRKRFCCRLYSDIDGVSFRIHMPIGSRCLGDPRSRSLPYLGCGPFPGDPVGRRFPAANRALPTYRGRRVDQAYRDKGRNRRSISCESVRSDGRARGNPGSNGEAIHNWNDRTV